MATRNITPTVLINTETKAGKKFVNGVERLKGELLKGTVNENTRFYKELSEEQIEANSFLHSILNNIKNSSDKEIQKFCKRLELKSIHLGVFGRKAGYNHYPIEEPYFRFVLHLGSPEIFYINNKPIPMLDGSGFMISPSESHQTHFTIYNEHIRAIPGDLHGLVPRIRPKDYKRTILIYDYNFNFKDSEIDNSISSVSENVSENSVSSVSENSVSSISENSENVSLVTETPIIPSDFN